MKKYFRLTCTVCKREIDKLVDLTHYTPDQCTITFGCEGRLQLLEYRSSAGIAVAPEIGVKDWRARGIPTSTNPGISAPALINLETGTLKQLVIGVPLATEPVATATHILTFNVKADTPKAYRQYIFRKEGSFTTVSGVESGLEKKALRFNAFGASPDVVEVYVNGVKRERGIDPEDYQIWDGVGTSLAPNTITFNTAIDQSGAAQIDVIVSKEAATSTVALVFKRNKPDESRANLGAYENVSHADRLTTSWQRYYMFTYDLDDSIIPLNSILLPPENSTTIFLLARQPYTQLDRYTSLVLPLADMSAERDYIKFYAVDSITTARATNTALTSIFPPLRIGKFATEKTIKITTVGIEEQLVIDSAVITGPDS